MSGAASVTFTPSGDDHVVIATHHHEHGLTLEPTANRIQLDEAHEMFRRAVDAALVSGSGYPVDAADDLLSAIRWPIGLSRIRQAPPTYFQFTIQEATNKLLPELVPVEPVRDGDGAAGDPLWLDRLAPSVRTFFVGGTDEPARGERSVAILFGEGDPRLDFAEWCHRVATALEEEGLHVDRYPGGRMLGRRRHEQLNEIFYQHGAVLFLGHLRGGKDGQGGWVLKHDAEPLKMRELRDFLNARRPAAEVVFAGCCSSATGDVERPGWAGLSYPKLFVEGRVRYFVGTWMDVVGREPEMLRGLAIGMAEGFLKRWAKDPTRAVQHLYDAKRELGFPLAASLFQIYARSNDRYVNRDRIGRTEAAPATSTPLDALISAVGVGDRLGDHTLEQDLWSDAHSRTFWATSPQGPHLVQVLSDAWQGDAQLATELTGAIAKLRAAEPGEHYLVPDRAELYAWTGSGRTVQPLLALIYDRPSSEGPDDWSTLAARPFERGADTHLPAVIALGALIAQALSTLHAQKLRHGSLSRDSVLFLRQTDGTSRVVLKDAWQSMLGTHRRQGGLYAAPDEMTAADEPKVDCWSLGMILCELATGSLPFPDAATGQIRASLGFAVRDRQRGLADAFRRILEECLLPSARLRPSAKQLWFRFTIAESYQAYVSEFEGDLFNRIDAGQRLFLIAIDDDRELDATLAQLEKRGQPVFTFRQGVGVTRHGTSDIGYAWIPEPAIDPWIVHSHLAEGLLPPAIDADTVLAANADLLLTAAVEHLRVPPLSPPAVLVIYDGVPWQSASAGTQLKMQRLLRRCETEPGWPVVIITGRFLFLDDDLDRSVHRLPFPPLAPAELFNRILSAKTTERLDVPDISDDEATELAKLLDPISARELTYALRLCALQHGQIDERVAEMRDLERARLLRERGHVTYFPLGQLPDPASMGLPAELRRHVERWADSARPNDWSDRSSPVPTRVLIDGPPGSGKTSLALALGSLTRRAVVRIEPAHAMGRNVGDSERNLRRVLNDVTFLAGAIVLLDDVDRVLASNVAAELPTLARMESLLLHWIDVTRRQVLVVMTASSPEALSPQWRRRVGLRFPLASPLGLNDGADSDPYRAAVFQAVFHRCGLTAMSQDRPFALELASATNPSVPRPRTLHSPSALVEPGGPLAHHTVRLATAADVEWWVQETLLLHGHRGDADAAEFWRDKLR